MFVTCRNYVVYLYINRYKLSKLFKFITFLVVGIEKKNDHLHNCN